MEISFDYWYMFFVMIGVSTMAMTFGIGGAAFLSPFLLIVLDMDPSIALGIGLFVEIFGFTSGVVGFARAGMIHYPLGLVMVALALPLSIGGVLLGKYIPANILQIIFGIGMLVLAVTMSLPDRQRLIKKSQYHKTCKEVHGDQVCFLLPKNKVPMMSLAGLGGIFMGLISVGIGEINEFLFVKRFKIHSGIAAGTSVFIVALTAISGAVTHGIHLASHATLSQLNQIFSVVIFCAPGAVVGAQVGVRVSRLIPEKMVKYLLVGIFLLISGLTLGKLLMP